MADVVDLRIGLSPGQLAWGPYASGWPSPLGLAFDYGAETIHFGAGLKEAEAKLLLRKIAARFPKIVKFGAVDP